MYDQTVRNYSGGQMAEFLRQPELLNEQYIIDRIGYVGKSIRDNYLSKVNRGKSLSDKAAKKSGIKKMSRQILRKIKHTIIRARPLQLPNADWNDALRRVADETVLSGLSFPSGHSAGLFVILTPLMLFSNKKQKKIALFCIAALHSFSRVYLAAHFPLDVIFGSLAGFVVAFIVYQVLFQEKSEKSIS